MRLDDEAVDRLRRLVDEPDLEGTPYRLDHEIARGGMGTVYQVTDERLGRRVALKVLHPTDRSPEAAARMLREAQVVARLEHPGIVPIHDVGTLADGRVYYTMKLVEGKRLDHLAAEAAPVPEILRTFQKTCEAVAFAHDRGVIHRDLKLQNVMVGAFGEVLVMDWGLAKLIREPEEVMPPEAGETAPPEAGETAPPEAGETAPPEAGETAPPEAGETGRGMMTRHGTVLGTPGYMAPEQARGEVALLDERADVYSLGVILWVLLSGEAAASPSAETLTADGGAMTMPPAKLRSGLPKALAAILAKATAENRGERYGNAAELDAEIRRLLDGLPVRAYQEPWLERFRRWTYKYRTAIALVVTYLLIRALMLIFLGR